MRSHAVVVGGGRMGSGIAQVLLTAGYRVQVVEAGDSAIERAKESVLQGLSKASQHGSLPGSLEELMGSVDFLSALSGIDPQASLLIEAVPEELSLKQEVLSHVEDLVGIGCLIATNTSSLSIDQLASVLSVKGRFLGLHFFNPVPVSDLVEVVVGSHTEEDALDRAVSLVHELGKKEIVVRDSPGFATSRLGVALGLEAIRMLEEGVARAEDIDRAMELGYKHPMGPLRLTDLVGLDVRLAIAEHLKETLGDRFEPPRLLREKVARGELGRKSGKGFYDW